MTSKTKEVVTMNGYYDFLKSKMAIAKDSGFEISPDKRKRVI